VPPLGMMPRKNRLPGGNAGDAPVRAVESILRSLFGTTCQFLIPVDPVLSFFGVRHSFLFLEFVPLRRRAAAGTDDVFAFISICVPLAGRFLTSGGVVRCALRTDKNPRRKSGIDRCNPGSVIW